MANEFFHKGGSPLQDGESPCKKVMLATPMGQQATAAYTLALASTTAALAKVGLPFDIYIHQANCHVDDARNTIIRGFLESDCSDLFFLDADLGWEPRCLLRLLAVPGDIVAGIYPHRAQDGDKETYPFHPGEGTRAANEHGLFEMHKVPTGFMRIRRHVLEKLYDNEKKAGRFWYWGQGAEQAEGRLPVCKIVERAFLSESGVKPKQAGTNADYHSGDYMLCIKAKQAGFSVFADIEMQFEHVGEMGFRGNLGDHLRREQKLDHPVFEQAARALASGNYPPEVFHHLHQFYGGKKKHFCLPGELLETCYNEAKQARGHILECGSGLSTLVMGLALKGTDHVLYSLEHDLSYMRSAALWLERYGVKNVVLIYAPLYPQGEDGEPENDWYGIDASELPESFDIVLVDGPPRNLGNRGVVFDVLKDRMATARVLMLDDVGSEGQLKSVSKGRAVAYVSGFAGTMAESSHHKMAVLRLPEPALEAAE